MNYKENIERILHPDKRSKIVGIVFVILTFWLIVFAIVSATGILDQKKKADFFDPMQSDQTNQDVYIDILAIDNDWSAQKDGKYYYMAVDTNPYFLLVEMTPEEYAQIDGTMKMNLMVKMPEKEGKTIRLYGRSTTIPYDVFQAVSETYGVDEVTVTDRVGYNYLEAGKESTNTLAPVLGLAAFVTGCIGLSLILYSRNKNRNISQTLQLLEQQGMLEMADKELQASDTDLYAGDHFLISKKDGLIIPYLDIQWIYRKDIRRRRMTANSFLVCHTRTMPNRTLNNSHGKAQREAMDEVLQVVAQKNPAALIGFTPENVKFFNENFKKGKKNG